MNNRNLSIDVFRGLAIILVTGFHVLQFIGNPAKPFFIFDFYAPFMRSSLGVALFVFISGYVTQASSSQLPAREFVKKRLWRITAPYYIALIIVNIFLAAGVVSGASHDLIDNISHVLFIHNLNPRTFFSISGLYWYIGLQMQLYAVYLLLRPWLKKHGFILGAASLIVCLCANILVLDWIGPYSAWAVVVTHSVFSYAFLFFMAGIIYEHRDRIVPYLQKPFIFYGLIVLTAAWIYIKRDIIGHGDLEAIMKGFLLGLIMLGMPAIDERHMILRPLIFIGQAAYSIYLYNYIFYAFNPRLYFITGLVIYSMITISFGVTMYYLIEEPLSRKKAALP